MPGDATHLVVSVGGNDALMNRDVLAAPVSSTAEDLELFRERAGEFESAYRRAIGRVLRLSLPAILCTIYNGDLPGDEGRIATIALRIFNDAIIRTAIEHGLDVIELRLVCSERADYANPIEPSGAGGRKIAQAIFRAVSRTDGDAATLVFR